ncbi:hypothetical protein [Thermanaerovibrio acidaminovorans]|jgi:hypothetical protein|uniref:hypothetical protein n=1 Tax=Thermanaerovibrio acidaminovorans TaxID=81462 RepID=UPI0001A3CFA2|nr:hypothetical protein [Thermanaerovibrio acidaminovorans]
MRVNLLYPDRELVRGTPTGWNPELPRDIGLDTVLDHMAQGDKFVRQAAFDVISRPSMDVETILHRQGASGTVWRTLRWCGGSTG